jgi:hypothetical protein
MVEYPRRPLGELLVERGALDQYELDHWLKEQRLSGMLLGELLVLHRVVSPMDVAAALAVQRGAESVASGIENGRKQQLGRILVERDLLTESGLQRVLLEQQRTGDTLGEVLVRRGYVSQEQIDEMLAEQRGADPSDEVLPAETQPAPDDVAYEVRVPGSAGGALHVSASFLDASDFAFDMLYDSNPDALDIVEVKGEQRKIAWSYVRPDDD